MTINNQRGALNALLIPLILLILLLGGAVSFGVWAFQGRQHYKNNVDQQIAVAVTAAKQQQSSVDASSYAQEAKKPLTSYSGPQTYGSVVVQYPKTWSSYVDSTGTGSALLDGYFNPGTVPAINSSTSTFALRVQVVGQTYAQVLQSFSAQQQAGQVTINPYSLPKVPNVVGVEATGTIGSNINGTMVVLPLRSNTLEIWTEGNQYLSDYSNNILPNFSFSP